MKLFAYAFLFLVSIFTTLANADTDKNLPVDLSGKSAIILPTGNLKIGGANQTIGAIFGAIGILAENTLTSKSREADESSEKNIIFLTAQKTIEEEISRLGIAKNIVLSEPTYLQETYSKIYNTDSRTETSGTGVSSNDLIFEFGFVDLNITKRFTGSYIEGVFGIRKIDAKTGKVLSKATTLAVGTMMGGEKILASSEDAKYEEEVKAAFVRFTQKITKTTFTKVSK